MLNGDMDAEGSTFKQGGMTSRLREFPRPARESDTYELYEDSGEPFSFLTRTVP